VNKKAPPGRPFDKEKDHMFNSREAQGKKEIRLGLLKIFEDGGGRFFREKDDRSTPEVSIEDAVSLTGQVFSNLIGTSKRGTGRK
jgi:hypothetical protein